jgi:hypothetical protein
MKDSSAKFNFLSLIYFIIGLTVAVPLLSLIYAWCILHNIAAVASPLITFVFAAFVGLIFERAIPKWSKLENGTIILIFCTIGAIVSFICAWIFWIILVIRRLEFSDFGNLLMNPSLTFEYIAKINEKGVWTVGPSSSSKTAISGWFLSITWILEMIIIIGLPIWMGTDPYKVRKEELNKKVTSS